jgi:hypothetical protein
MQAVLRATGKESMDGSQYENFVEAFEKGTLLEPEKPGNVIAKLAVEPAKHLSGKFLSYVLHTAENHVGNLLTRTSQMERARVVSVPG